MAGIFTMQSMFAKWIGDQPDPQQGGSIDSRIIAGIRNLKKPDDKSLFSDLVALFVSTAESRIGALKEGIAQKDAKGIAIQAHTLRSGSANLGAHHMATIAGEIEELSLQSQLERCPELCDRLSAEFLKVKEALRIEVLKHEAEEASSVSVHSNEVRELEPKKKILLVEDSAVDQTIVSSVLQKDYTVTVAATAADAVYHSEKSSFDMILLDVMLPDMDGFTLCTHLRRLEKTRDIPIIFLTAKTALGDKVNGLSIGADDYIVKPFEPLELLARIQAKFTRLEALRSKTDLLLIAKGNLKVDLSSQRAYLIQDKKEMELDLTPVEFKLLSYFLQNEGAALTRDQLLEAVWGKGVNVLHRTIDKHVCSLRKKLSVEANRISTVSGMGYRFSSTY